MKASLASVCFIIILCSIILCSACGDDAPVDDAAVDMGVTDTAYGEIDGGEADAVVDTQWGPTPEFHRFCVEQPWEETLLPAVAGELSGAYAGVYADLPEGSLETMKIIAEHPFQVTAIRAGFAGETGPIRIRLMHSFGRSYPDLDSDHGDLIEPIEMVIEDPDPETWFEFDVSEEDVFLLPTEHYILVSERMVDGPMVAVEELAEGDWSRALLHIPNQSVPGGSDGNLRLTLAGNTFCHWGNERRLFEEAQGQSFENDPSSRAAIADLNSDGHDDLILNAGGPIAHFGDGHGQFVAPDFDPFPDVPHASMLVFADVDNDGDVDAFSGTYVSADGDGDGVTKSEQDCNDADASVHPGADEIPENGLDDDCDGQTDDGTDLSDADADGFGIGEGDCDDTRDSVFPNADELNDGMDNNCDGMVDEPFVNHILINDGSGRFSLFSEAGVEVLDHSTAAGFGDANGDGNLDLYWGNWLVHYPDDPATDDRYFEGNGDGTFVDAQWRAALTLDTPLSCYGVMWNDFNNDGHQDIFVGNYHLYANQLWQNLGNGTFMDVAEYVGAAYDDIPSGNSTWPGGHTFGGDFGDIDNDGDIDLYMANLAHPRVQPWSDPSMFLINEGPPNYRFTNMREEYGFIYDEGDVNAAFADFDNDTDLDIAVASLYRGHFSRFYRNDGLAGFTDITYETNTAINDAVSVVWSDVDEDGDLDLFIADRWGPETVHLFINQVGQDNNWLELVLEGTTSNRGAIGARVSLTAGGVTQIRDVRGGGGHSNTQNSRVVHFGLGQENAIDSVTVRWVGGATETIDGLVPNGRFHVVQGSGLGEEL